MTVRPRAGAWQVEVNDASALEGYRRIRKQRPTEAQANNLEAEIQEALRVYGKWPVQEGDEPRALEDRSKKVGNLRQATELALETHWKGMPCEDTVRGGIWPCIRFFEDIGARNIEEIGSEEMDKFLVWQREVRKNSNAHINHLLSYLSVINQVANDRKPPITSERMPIKRLPNKRAEKWWLRPEDLERVETWLRRTQGDDLFADFILMIVRQGFRIEELLRLEVRHFVGIDSGEPWILIPGTKTKRSQDSIPMYDWTLDLAKACIERANRNRWKTLFPISQRQTMDRWNEVRDFLEVRDIATSTLKSLRRTFAFYANQRKMPTKVLQSVLRHETITTTEGYLNLVGADYTGQSRGYMKIDGEPIVVEDNPEVVSDLKDIISAYKASGATPKEIAELVRELRAG